MTTTRETDLGFAGCRHSNAGGRGAIALVAMGNTLRGDDGVAQFVCANLPCKVGQEVCQFDLGTYSNFLALCFAGHEIAIILDAVNTGQRTGSTTILDVSDPARDCSVPNIGSTHGFSLAHELQIASKMGCRPRKTILFGIEVSDTGWRQSLSNGLMAQVPELVDQLVAVINSLQSTGLQPKPGWAQGGCVA